MLTALPSRTTVLVIGGGPAGAYAASALARENIDTTVIEAAKFPRYHVGESMLPSLNTFMQFIGAEEKFRNHGFTVKPGAAVKFTQHKKEAYVDFVRNGNATCNVIRSEFDDMLLRHAEKSGARVFEETKVTEIEFETKGAEMRPTSATYRRNNGEVGLIHFDYLVDASGRNGIVSTKYLKNRKMNPSFHNLACWGYWTGQKQYMPNSDRHNAPWFESLTDESGWGWFIPLHDGTVSVGIVMHSSISAQKKAEGRKVTSDGDYTLKDHYLDQLHLVPGLKGLLEGATLKEDSEHYRVRSAADYSYAADKYAGDHYRIIGDASSFIDPFFSTGVHLALLGGLNAAASIAASARKQCAEETAWKFHDVKVATAYTRSSLVVMSAYKQIRNQSMAVLSGVNEDDYDRAFETMRPIIQGTSDMGKKLSEDELRRAIDFCKDILAPTNSGVTEEVGARLQPELLAANALISTGEEISKEFQGDRLNAHMPVDQMYEGADNLQVDDVDGYVMHLRRGALGLVKVASA